MMQANLVDKPPQVGNAAKKYFGTTRIRGFCHEFILHHVNSNDIRMRPVKSTLNLRERYS